MILFKCAEMNSCERALLGAIHVSPPHTFAVPLKQGELSIALVVTTYHTSAWWTHENRIPEFEKTAIYLVVTYLFAISDAFLTIKSSSIRVHLRKPLDE